MGEKQSQLLLRTTEVQLGLQVQSGVRQMCKMQYVECPVIHWQTLKTLTHCIFHIAAYALHLTHCILHIASFTL